MESPDCPSHTNDLGEILEGKLMILAADSELGREPPEVSVIG